MAERRSKDLPVLRPGEGQATAGEQTAVLCGGELLSGLALGHVDPRAPPDHPSDAQLRHRGRRDDAKCCQADSPAEGSEPRRTTWTSTQARQFLEYVRVEDQRFYAYVLLLVLGLWKGEILGLSWGQIDLEQAELTPDFQVQREARSCFVER